MPATYPVLRKNARSSPISGFTLIELLIVITIIAILAGIGYPSYQQYLQNSRRQEGQAALFDLANRLENYYAEHNTYAAATLGTGNSETDILATNFSPAGWYMLSIVNQNEQDFLIQAIPQKAQINDTECQALTLNSLDEKGIAAGPKGAPTGTFETCW